jgi:hypothetical protein
MLEASNTTKIFICRESSLHLHGLLARTKPAIHTVALQYDSFVMIISHHHVSVTISSRFEHKCFLNNVYSRFGRSPVSLFDRNVATTLKAVRTHTGTGPNFHYLSIASWRFAVLCLENENTKC